MKAILFILVVAGCAFAQTPVVTCASGTNRVREGQTITCTSSSSVTWSLTGTGSLSGQTSTSVTYNAPSSVTVNHNIGGCPVMPNDSIFNTKIDNLPLNSNSATWVSGVVAGNPITSTYVGFGELSWGFSTANSSTPTKNLVNFYGGSTSGFPIPSGMNLKQEQGDYHADVDNQDHHLMEVKTDTCQFFEAYAIHAPYHPDGNGCNGSAGTGAGCNAQSSISYNWSDYINNSGGLSGTDGGGLPILPLSLHLSDIYNGSLNHPLRFTSCTGCVYNVPGLWPAGGQGGSNTPTAPPYGAWFRLRLCGVNGVSTNCATLSNYTANQQIILNGLHYHGMILGDIGSMIAVTPATDLSLDRAVLADVDNLGIPIGDFEVVDASSLQFAANSYETCPINSTCVGAQNRYETPANQAIIVATPTGSGSAVSTPIAIQGVSIGLNAPALWMEAGSYTYQIPSWVNGTSNQSVTWTKISGPGSVTSGGVYTPASPTGSPAVLKVTSAADSNATAYEYIYLLPQGSNPTNSIRIDSGNYNGYGGGTTVDGNGNSWLPDSGLEDASPGCCGGDGYPGWQNFLSNPELGVYETYGYGEGATNDILYSFIVPNGNYKVRAMYGQPNGPSGTTVSMTTTGWTERLHLETQGNIQAHNFNPFLNGPAGYVNESRVPTDVYVPAKVTNNLLQFANRAVFFATDEAIGAYPSCNCSSNNTINGLEIIPDSTPAHWAIDAQQQTTVTAGGAPQAGGGWWVNSLGSPFEIATAFVPTTSGYIAGVRFYKAATDTGTHTGSLWINNGGPFGSQVGTLLTSGTFSGETASGWQTLLFGSPVAVIGGVQYVVSYHTTTGNIWRLSNGYASPLVQPFINGPLQAYMGLYNSGSGGVFPASVNKDMFAVDPIFSLNSNGSNPVTLFPTNGLPGKQIQMYVQDWYTGVNDPTWTIVSGPGTIQASTDIFGNPVGIYTAPWTTPGAGAAVVINAQSQSNPAISATTTLYFTGATNGVAK